MADADIHFYFDPVCPFAWMTSKWVRMVQAQRDYRVDWRFISLRLVNADVDYATRFPPEYEAGHTAGLRLLRAAASVRREHGSDAVGPLYEALGTHIFDTEIVPDDGTRHFALTVASENRSSKEDTAALYALMDGHGPIGGVWGANILAFAHSDMT